jgi:hypothetical protein
MNAGLETEVGRTKFKVGRGWTQKNAKGFTAESAENAEKSLHHKGTK